MMNFGRTNLTANWWTCLSVYPWQGTIYFQQCHQQEKWSKVWWQAALTAQKDQGSPCRLLDEGCKQLAACLHFGVFNGPTKKIEFPTVYLGISEQIKLQVWVQVQATAGSLAITLEGYFTRQSRGLTAKTMAELFRQCLATAWKGSNWSASRLQSLLAVTGLLKEKVLPLLQ